MNKVSVYGSFTQALFFSGTLSVPKYLITHYKKMGLSDQEMMVLLQILGETETNPYPSADALAERMTQSLAEIEFILTDLVERNILSVEQRWDLTEQQWQPAYSIAKLIVELADLWVMEYSQQQDQAKVPNLSASAMENLIRIFEQELGRLLTRLECENLERWLAAHYSEEIIVEALRRGVSAGIRNFRYLDSILREWEKKGLRTRVEIEAEDANFQARQEKKVPSVKNAGRRKGISPKYGDFYL